MYDWSISLGAMKTRLQNGTCLSQNGYKVNPFIRVNTTRKDADSAINCSQMRIFHASRFKAGGDSVLGKARRLSKTGEK